MKDKIEGLIYNLNQKALAVLFSFFSTITFIDLVDFGLRALSGIVAVGVGILAYQNYRLKNQLLRKEIELKDQELEEILRKKKNKKEA